MKFKFNINYLFITNKRTCKILGIFISFIFFLHRNKLDPKCTKYEMNELIEPNNNQMVYNPNKTLIELEKKMLLEFISKSISKNISKVVQIFLGQPFHFGNQLRIISKVIFYCQILGCKKIIIEKSEYNWFLQKEIKLDNFIITVERLDNIKCYDTIIDRTTNFMFYSKYIIPTSQIKLLKNEILNNLPKINVNKDDLFIYIRSGDIFIEPHYLYIQPPYCFYEKILNDFYFKKVFLIAENRNNPVIDNLLKRYPNIIYKKQSLQIDISKLVRAYNLAGGSVSSFFSTILELTINLQILFYYNLEHQSDLSIEKVKKYIMYAPKEYLKVMRPWNNTKFQRTFMNTHNCSNDFVLE